MLPSTTILHQLLKFSNVNNKKYIINSERRKEEIFQHGYHEGIKMIETCDEAQKIKKLSDDCNQLN